MGPGCRQCTDGARADGVGLKRQATAAALLVGALCAGCAGKATTGCSGLYRACTPFEADCGSGWTHCRSNAGGATEEIVQIDSQPTTAAIYVDGRFVGYSPLRHRMRYTSETARIEVAAVPLFSRQTQQVREIVVPPLPRRVLFSMTNTAVSAHGQRSQTVAGVARGRRD